MSLHSFYKSRDWQDLLTIIKGQRTDENGFIVCEYCKKPIVRTYDCIGHHKEQLTEENYRDSRISLNPENIMLVHHKCHNIIHDRLGMCKERQVFIVYGSPLSGKSTWIKGNMATGDLVIDMDNIWQCISGCERYVKPNRLKSVVFAVRDTLIESVRYRRGKWLNAYIAGGYPYQGERERLADMLGAREIHIDTDKDTCLKRLMECKYRDKNEWQQYIEDWWQQYEGGY